MIDDKEVATQEVEKVIKKVYKKRPNSKIRSKGSIKVSDKVQSLKVDSFVDSATEKNCIDNDKAIDKLNKSKVVKAVKTDKVIDKSVKSYIESDPQKDVKKHKKESSKFKKNIKTDKISVDENVIITQFDKQNTIEVINADAVKKPNKTLKDKRKNLKKINNGLVFNKNNTPSFIKFSLDELSSLNNDRYMKAQKSRKVLFDNDVSSETFKSKSYAPIAEYNIMCID